MREKSAQDDCDQMCRERKRRKHSRVDPMADAGVVREGIGGGGLQHHHLFCTDLHACMIGLLWRCCVLSLLANQSAGRTRSLVAEHPAGREEGRRTAGSQLCEVAGG